MTLGRLVSMMQRGFDIQPRGIKRRTLVNHFADANWLTVLNRIGALTLASIAVHYVSRLALGM